MKTIKIKIADNLTAEQEAFAIGKQLAKRALSSGAQNKEVKRIGTQIDIIDLKTTIEVERFSTEKAITMLTCSVCGCEYQSNMAKYYFHNYGGGRQRRLVCSVGCVDYMVDNFAPRVQKSANKLPHPINYFRRTI